jgi:hypothetical protein
MSDIYAENHQNDPDTRCGVCDGAGYFSNTGCCGNPLRSGEYCGNGIEVQDQCKHCHGSGIEPPPFPQDAEGRDIIPDEQLF